MLQILKKIKLSEAILCIMALSLLITASGCAVVMAIKQPDKKDLNVLTEGTPRTSVIAELGVPLWSGEENDKKTDIFNFTQGYSKGTKVGRALFHGAADVFSFGLWEVIGTSSEAIFDGKDMKIKVVYNNNDLVESIEYLHKQE
jgi:hypothetical protein